jgi:hypothetical protein
MKKKLITGFLLMAAMTTAWLVFAAPGKTIITAENISLSAADEEEPGVPVAEATEDEKQIIQTLKDMFAGIGDSASYSYIRGGYSYNDPADSSYNIEETEIEYCVKNDSLFYKTNDMVIVNTPFCYANADKGLKRVVISPAKSMQQAIEFPLKEMGKFYKTNDYKMERTVADSVATIRIYNDHHLNCKEIVIVYSIVTNKPSSMKYRFTDTDDPFNNHLDKIMKFSIKEWVREQAEVRTKAFPNIADVNNDRIKLSADFAGYGIINLLNN